MSDALGKAMELQIKEQMGQNDKSDFSNPGQKSLHEVQSSSSEEVYRRPVPKRKEDSDSSDEDQKISLMNRIEPQFPRRHTMSASSGKRRETLSTPASKHMEIAKFI